MRSCRQCRDTYDVVRCGLRQLVCFGVAIPTSSPNPSYHARSPLCGSYSLHLSVDAFSTTYFSAASENRHELCRSNVEMTRYFCCAADSTVTSNAVVYHVRDASASSHRAMSHSGMILLYLPVPMHDLTQWVGHAAMRAWPE